MIDPIRAAEAAAVDGATPAGPARPVAPLPGPGNPLFRQVLEAQLGRSQGPLKFSSHALERLNRRGIHLDEASLARLDEGVHRVAAKGGRESLVLVGDTAFVVSVRNRTVITAVDREHMKEQVFTNIDSAVIA